MKKVLFFIIIIGTNLCAEIPENIRKQYALKLHEAFTLQCAGKSTQAFYSFQEGFQQGIKAGESAIKLQVVADLFYWYRKYGTHLHLFAKPTIGDNQITDEYKGQNCKRHKHNGAAPLREMDRYSEWGNNPQQARIIQDFMFGVGELISGIFIVAVLPQSLLVFGGSTGLITHGIYTIKESLQDLWTQHQIELFELEKISERATQTSKNS